MATFPERLKSLRKSRNMSQRELAKVIKMSKSSINMYERGEREPGLDTFEALADYFNVDFDYLTGKSNIANKSLCNSNTDFPNGYAKYGLTPIRTHKVPTLGEIACGKPIYADETRESYVEAGVDIQADFCLKAKGDSMINARIQNGDIIFVKEQPIVENGDIAAVIIEDEVTLKRVYYYQDRNKLVLQAENPKYEPLIYFGEELEHIHILGKAIAFQSDL